MIGSSWSVTSSGSSVSKISSTGFAGVGKGLRVDTSRNVGDCVVWIGRGWKTGPKGCCGLLPPLVAGRSVGCLNGAGRSSNT